jgi:hypothetical protein
MGIELNFSENFISILKQFQKISDQMYFISGSTQSVISPTGRIFAQATSDVEIEIPFAVYSLKKLLAILSLYKNPKIIINETLMKISTEDDRKTVNYQLTIPDFVKYEKKPNRYLKMTDDISFKMMEMDYVEAVKLASILNSDLIIFSGNGERISITTEKIQSGDVGRIDLGENPEIFKASIPTKVFDIMKADYDVTISRKGAIRFVTNGINYFFSVEKSHSSL